MPRFSWPPLLVVATAAAALLCSSVDWADPPKKSGDKPAAVPAEDPFAPPSEDPFARPGEKRRPVAAKKPSGAPAKNAKPQAKLLPEAASRDAEAAIRAALDKPISLDFHDTPLETAAAYLTDKCHVPVLLDQKSLDDVGTELTVPITFRVSNVSLRSALRLMLRPLDLTYLVCNEVLMITTPEEAEDYEVTRVYPVADLFERSPDGETVYLDFDSLSDLIMRIVQPTSWGTGTQVLPATDLAHIDSLVFSQTEEVHEEVAALLESLRSLVRQAAQDQPVETVCLAPDTPATKAIYAALDKPVSFDFPGTPLATVAECLGQMSGINVLLDRRALADVQLSGDTPVTLRVKDVSLRSALQQLLRPLGLTYVVWDEVLLITTPEEYERQLTVMVYPVGDLVVRADDRARTASDLNALSEVITKVVHPTTWDSLNGRGCIEPLKVADLDALVISQTSEVHVELAALFRAFRSVAQQSKGGRAPEQIFLDDTGMDQDPKAKAIRAALDKEANFHFVETPLADVIAFISKTYGIQCRLDVRALDDVGIPEDTPITRNLKGISLRSALRLMLHDLDLTYLIRDGVLLITTPEESETRLTLGVYPVGDLVGKGKKTAEGFDGLKDVISNCIEPTTWDAVGGPGSMAVARLGNIDALVIAQTKVVHEEIAALLAGIRAAGRRVGGEREHEPLIYDGQYEENAPAEVIRKSLSKKVSLDFDETRLADFLDFVQKTFGIPWQLDYKAMDDVGIGTDCPITIQVSGVSLGAALRLVLDPRDLCWVIRDEVLLVTTPEEMQTNLLVGIYPVGDLVVCRNAKDELWDDYESLAHVIFRGVEPNSWADAVGPGDAVGGTFGKAKVLVVAQIQPVHERIVRLLGDLRAEAAKAPGDGRPPRREKPGRLSPEPSPGEGKKGSGFF